MTIIFIILITLASVILGFIVLVQNPKGGGLAGNVAGLSNQFMGVKQTTDVLEKGTWIFGGIIALLCLFSTFFMPKAGSGGVATPEVTLPATNQAPVNTAPPTGPAPVNPAPGN
jgi:preprotein translocase subunit SecG